MDYKFLKKYLDVLSISLILVGVIILLLLFTNISSNLKTICANIGSALVVSAIINLIYQYNILPIIKGRPFDKYGVTDTFIGRLSSTNKIEEKINSANKHIDILGVTAYSVLFSDTICDSIEKAVLKGVSVRILVADPNSTEIKIQEKYEDKINQHISRAKALFTKYDSIASRINDNSTGNLSIKYSISFPKMSIIRFDDTMYISNFGLKGFEKSPTWKLLKKDGGHFNYFENYFDQLNSIGS